MGTQLIKLEQIDGELLTASSIHGTTEKPSGLHENDEFLIMDADDSYLPKKTLWGTIRDEMYGFLSSLFADVNHNHDGTYTPCSGWIPGTGSWSYSSADAPTFVISVNADVTSLIGVGNRIKLTQTTDKYFIVTAVGSYSGGATLVTVYGGTDYTLANAGITSPYYSNIKAPFGFPLDPLKWTVIVDNTTTYTKTTPTATTWYHAMDSGSLPEITFPIGCWDAYYEAAFYATRASATTTNVYITLSTANNTESDKLWTAFTGIGGASGTLIPQIEAHKRKFVTVTTKTLMYMNAKTQAGADSFTIAGAIITTKLRAVCAYL